MSLFLAGVAARVGSLRVSGAADAGGAYVMIMVMEGAEKQAGRLWDKFGMKEVVEEKWDTLYVGVGHQNKAMVCVCHTQEGMHLMEVGRRNQG